MIDQIIDWLLKLSGPLGLGGLVLYFVKDFRKNRVDTELAEKTLPSSIRVKDAEGDQATLVTIERAFTIERESRERTIAALREEVDELREETHEKDEIIRVQGETIVALRSEVATLTERLAQITAEFGSIRDRLNSTPTTPQE